MRPYPKPPALVVSILIAGLAFAQTQGKPPAPAQKPAAGSAASRPAEKPAGQLDTAKEPAEETIPPAGPDALFPAVVARVNGKAVLGRDLEQRIQAQLAPIGSPKWQNLREDYRQELTNQALGALLAAELLYQRATVTGVKVTETEVKAEYDKVQKTFTTDAEMNMALANRGLDRTGLTRELERNLIVAKFILENVTKKIAITPAEVQEYYKVHPEEFKHPDMVKTSHILIVLPEGATAEQEGAARKRAEALLQRARKGEDFAKLAKENSMDASASQGGDIGFLPKGQLAPEYEEAAFRIPVGSISDVVRTQFGYHIIKVTDRRKEGTSTLDEIRTDLHEFLKKRKADGDVDKLVKELRDQAKIELLIPVGPGESTTSSRRP